MCGIVGFNFDDRELLKKMIKSLKHRGPDDSGALRDKFVSLGHTRLSIIDLNNGRQPISNEDETKWIIFNGEIFNFKELRKELEKKHKFKTNTDTEVILHGYEEWGFDVLKKINGQFSFCIYDPEKKEMFLARDRLGINPLYYYYKDDFFYFASEMKAILCDEDIPRIINDSVINDYVSYGYVPAPKSIIKDIYKLSPGHFAIYDLKKNNLEIRKYWDLDFKTQKTPFNLAKSEILNKLEKSIQRRMISDVPIGTFLSGGIDSSTIVALMSKINQSNNEKEEDYKSHKNNVNDSKKNDEYNDNYSYSNENNYLGKEINTFSMGFEGVEDELELAKKTSDMYNTNHKEFVLNSSDFSLIPKLIYYADEPFADSSIIPTYLISNCASKFVKVCLSGDGGDENFAGYERYIKNKYEKLYSKIPLYNDRFKRIKEISKFKNDSERFIKGNECYIDSEKKELLNMNLRESFKYKFIKNYSDKINNLLYLDIKTTLPEDYLKKVDVASMSNSLEVRTPFLDHEFIEYTASLPSNYKISFLDKKHILKKSVKDLIPKEVLNGKKKGFSIPLNLWLKKDLKDTLYDIIISSTKRGYFNKNYIEKIWEQHQKNMRDNSSRLWAIVCFEIWCRIYIDKIKIEEVLKL